MSDESSAPAPTGTPSERPATAAARGPAVAEHGVARHDLLRAESWSSRGTAKVLRDVEVGRTDLVGATTIGGALRADAVEARGTLEVTGPVEGREQVSVRGELRAGSTVHGGDVTVHGVLRAVGAVSADRRAELRGTVDAPSIAAAEALLEGRILVPGRLRAARVDLRPTDRSRIGQIEGESVRVRARAAGPVESILGSTVEVTIDRIDGTRVELEGVAVGLVHAAEVVLGRRAHVRAVEGTVVSAHRTSHLGPESRSRPPPGLSR